jgi:hypothetical protein
MAGRQSRRDKQRSAFGYVVGHLYFYGQKDWPGGMSYEYPGILWTCIKIFVNKYIIITMGGLGGVNNSKNVHNFESNSRVNLPGI